MNYSKQTVDKIDGTLYTSQDGRMRLYACDIFKMTSDIETGFQAMYDRGGFVALNIRARRQYAELLRNISAADCRVLLVTVTFKSVDYSPPPHSIQVTIKLN